MCIGYASAHPRPPNLRPASALTDIHRIKWDDLQVMLLVNEYGQFRGGTVTADVSLNTARGAVARLERVYRQQLLIRSVGGVSLTERGQELVSAVNVMRAAIQRTLR